MSRLDFAPKRSEIKVTDVTKGLGRFAPKPDKPVSFDQLTQTLKKAGYTLAEAAITAQGAVENESGKWFLRIPESNQRFELRGFAALSAGKNMTAGGRWTTESGVEAITAQGK